MNRLAIAGLALMTVSQAATLAGNDLVATWNTPLCWTGFILFADSIVWKARGSSWIRSHSREFACLALVSIPLWLVFEFYNLFIHNWYYAGLPENKILRCCGYAWSFATIWPAIFEGAELMAVWRSPPRRFRGQPGRSKDLRDKNAAEAHTNVAHLKAHVAHDFGPAHMLSIVAGTAMLLWPLIWPSPYLAAPVWLGFIFLLDPINARLGGESLLDDFRQGRHERTKNLVLSGFLCGILWEFWNYWSRAKWHYTVPIMENLKIFEMPLPGYLGFPVFALECFTMYVFLRGAFLAVADGFGRFAAGRPQPGRRIAL